MFEQANFLYGLCEDDLIAKQKSEAKSRQEKQREIAKEKIEIEQQKDKCKEIYQQGLVILEKDYKFTMEMMTKHYTLFTPKRSLSHALADHLKLYCYNENIIPIDLAKRAKAFEELNKHELDLGMEIIYFLIELDILEKHRYLDAVPYCKFKHNYEINCYTSAKYYKPLHH